MIAGGGIEPGGGIDAGLNVVTGAMTGGCECVAGGGTDAGLAGGETDAGCCGSSACGMSGDVDVNGLAGSPFPTTNGAGTGIGIGWAAAGAGAGAGAEAAGGNAIGGGTFGDGAGDAVEIGATTGMSVIVVGPTGDDAAVAPGARALVLVLATGGF